MHLLFGLNAKKNKTEQWREVNGKRGRLEGWIQSRGYKQSLM